MPYIVSTLATSVDYADYHPKSEKEGGPNVVRHKVTVKGGSGVASRPHALAAGVLTPDGVVTSVSTDDLAFLMEQPVFKRHLAAGHVKIMGYNPNSNEKKTADMNKADASAPLTDRDFKDGGRAKMPESMTVKSASLQ